MSFTILFIKKPINFRLSNITFLNKNCFSLCSMPKKGQINNNYYFKETVPRPSGFCEAYSKGLREREKWKTILGRGSNSPNQYSHQLASEYIKSGKPVNFNIINDILAYCNISISSEILTELIHAPSIIIKNLDKEESKKIIKDNIGTPSNKIQIPGVYIFTHKNTGQKYVGSSSQLAIRLFGYLNFKYKTTARSRCSRIGGSGSIGIGGRGARCGRGGKLIPFIHKEKLSNFSLEIIPLYDNYDFRSEIVLEQYYLLDPSFNLNTIKVANNPSGSNAKPLYMYNRDKTVLYYSSTQQKDFIINLNISHFTFSKHLKKGSYYLGKYLFSRAPELTAKVKDISVLELALQLENDRKKFNKNKPLNSSSKSVLMYDENNNTKLFFSLGKCIKYLRAKGFHATQTTLVKYVNIDKIYYGYKFKYV